MRTRVLWTALLVVWLSGCFWAAREEEPKYTFPEGIGSILPRRR